jgi:hypothetical protein
MIVNIILILIGIVGMSNGSPLFGFLVMMLGILELFKDKNQPTKVSPIINIAYYWNVVFIYAYICFSIIYYMANNLF